ncbi:MAG: hypothetical protein U9Q19_06385 [Pseudomonadota bacterium]|nr:hypothetical protein [Pseudomonadota bacterium]
MSKWESFSAKVRAFGVAITPSVEGLTLESLKRFKNEPALWIGAVGAVVVAAFEVREAGGDGWTMAAAIVIAYAGFVTRRHVSPVKLPDAGPVVTSVTYSSSETLHPDTY